MACWNYSMVISFEAWLQQIDFFFCHEMRNVGTYIYFNYKTSRWQTRSAWCGRVPVLSMYLCLLQMFDVIDHVACHSKVIVNMCRIYRSKFIDWSTMLLTVTASLAWVDSIVWLCVSSFYSLRSLGDIRARACSQTLWLFPTYAKKLKLPSCQVED